MKHLFLSLSLTLTSLAAAAQNDVQRYMFDEAAFPVCLDSMQRELTYPMAWGNSPITDFNKWRSAARSKLREEMLLPPPPAKTYNVKLVAEEQRKGYKARRIAFNLDAYSRVEAYELIPDGKGPFPAVLLLHDHGGHYSIGKEKMIRPFAVADSVVADADGWAKRCYGGQYMGDYLAAKGYVVLSIDAPVWGERGVKGSRNPAEMFKYVAGNFMMLGRNVSAWMNFDDEYSADFLASLPEVDSTRVGCMGFSMGGYRAWMVSALSDRIKAGAAICWMHTTEYQMNREYGLKRHEEWANLIPGIKRWMDYPHIASMACPKPMLFINGSKDHLFPEPSVKKAFAQMHDVWRSQVADDKLETEIWDMSHYCGPEVQLRILEFLDKRLK